MSKIVNAIKKAQQQHDEKLSTDGYDVKEHTTVEERNAFIMEYLDNKGVENVMMFVEQAD